MRATARYWSRFGGGQQYAEPLEIGARGRDAQRQGAGRRRRRSPRLATSSTSTEVTHEGPGHGCRGARRGRRHPVAAAPRRRRGDRRRHGPLGQRASTWWTPGRGAWCPPGRADDFVDVVRGICRDERVDVLFPTVDVELPKLAAARDELLADGTILASPALQTLETCLDKLALAARVRRTVRVPRTELLGTPQAVSRLGLPGHRQAPPRCRVARRPAGRHAGRARRGARRRRGPARPGAAARRRVLGRRPGRARRPGDRRRAAGPPAGGLRGRGRRA